MAQKFIITGGPGSGKTTALNILAEQGYHIVPEAARMVLTEQPNLTGTALQQEILNRQSELEANVQGTVYLDRGLVDCEAYAKYFGSNLSGTDYEQKLSQAQYEPIVFHLEPLPREFYKNDAQRKETYEEAVEISDMLKETYKARGFTVISVSGNSTPQDRLETILKESLKELAA